MLLDRVQCFFFRCFSSVVVQSINIDEKRRASTAWPNWATSLLQVEYCPPLTIQHTEFWEVIRGLSFFQANLNHHHLQSTSSPSPISLEPHDGSMKSSGKAFAVKLKKVVLEFRFLVTLDTLDAHTTSITMKLLPANSKSHHTRAL